MQQWIYARTEEIRLNHAVGHAAGWVVVVGRVRHAEGLVPRSRLQLQIAFLDVSRVGEVVAEHEQLVRRRIVAATVVVVVVTVALPGLNTSGGWTSCKAKQLRLQQKIDKMMSNKPNDRGTRTIEEEEGEAGGDEEGFHGCCCSLIEEAIDWKQREIPEIQSNAGCKRRWWLRMYL
jgi:hypothetical protein